MLTPTALPLTVTSLDRGRKVEHPEVTVFRIDLDFFMAGGCYVRTHQKEEHTLCYMN